MNLQHGGLSLIAAAFVAQSVAAQSPEVPRARSAPALDEPLVTRPGMMIGRVMTWDGRRLPRFTIEYAAHTREDGGIELIVDAEPNAVANIDGDDCYSDFRSARASERLICRWRDKHATHTNCAHVPQASVNGA